MSSPRHCPVCDAPPQQARVFLDEHVDPARLTGLSFASRKTPEFMNHHLVQCQGCDLVYADTPPGQDELARAYHASEFDSAVEADDAARAYLQAIQPVLAQLAAQVLSQSSPNKAALEIGAGTGVFLEHLSEAGFTQVCGVEPSPAAIAAAPVARQPWLREAIFRAEDFEPASFDLVCCFMTMEHVRDPGEVARAVQQLLKPGGAFVVVVHDWRAPLNRLLGKRSPIIDIEHMQLFSPASIERLFTEAGLVQVRSHSFANRYALRYWARLLPLPGGLRTAFIRALDALGLGSLKLRFNVGNRLCVGWRPLPGKA